MPTNRKELAPSSETAAAEVQSNHDNPLIGAEKLKQLYATMLQLRLMNERRHSARGGSRPRGHHREACEAACTLDLRGKDTVIVFPDQQIGHVAKGVIACERSAKVAGKQRPDRPNNERESSPNVLEQDSDRIGIATGVALANRLHKNGAVVIAFCEPGELSSKTLLNFGLEHSLPIIYVQLPGSKRRGRRLKRSPAIEVATIPVDESDVIAVYRVACEAIEKARRGAGPTLMQCVPFQLGTFRKRSDNRQDRDPIAYMESYLAKKNLWSREFKAALTQTFSQHLREAPPGRKSRRSAAHL